VDLPVGHVGGGLGDTRRVPLNLYRFRSVWPVDCAPADAFDVLADLGSYPLWWPEVRRAVQVGEERAELRCRSVLPYDLVFEASHHTRDAERRVLVANLEGDLDGTVGWRVEADEPGSRLLYEQVVTVRKPLLRALGPLLRPALVANHELMMRHGRRGLRTYLAGFTKGAVLRG
jgi:hypothetical protein